MCDVTPGRHQPIILSQYLFTGDFVECGDGSKVHRYYWCDQWPERATSHLDDTNRLYYHNIYLQVTSWNVETEAKSTATTGVTSGLNVRRHTWTKPI
ncbi:hypothetical protein J6590_105791, partial [Homalodisca vitripennis]